MGLLFPKLSRKRQRPSSAAFFLLTATSLTLGAPPSPMTCASCHRAETASSVTANMPQALETAASAAILKSHAQLSTHLGSYSYSVLREGDRSFYTVSNGYDSLRLELSWAFGQGEAGQTYLFERDGHWYESRVSFYSALNGLDATLGSHDKTPENLEEAAGRRMTQSDARDCFQCHATGAVHNGSLDLAGLTPGVQCARCHGDVTAHQRAVTTGDAAHARLPRLNAMSAEEQSDFCGQCHRSWSQIAMNGPRGVVNVRFQPYRLTKSKCYDSDERRIRCTSCHNPHENRQTSSSFYDTKCLVCHSRSASPATRASSHLCKVSQANCVSCHMPKTDLPGSHKLFTDHFIRIAKAGERYPD